MKCKHYHIESNLGTEDRPFIVIKDLGKFPSNYEAYKALTESILDCNVDADWHLYCDNTAFATIKPNVYEMEEGPLFALIDLNGFVIKTNDDDHAENEFKLAGSTLSNLHWQGDLIFIEYINYKLNYLSDDDLVVALDKNGRIAKTCAFTMMVAWLTDQEQKHYLYKEIQRK